MQVTTAMPGAHAGLGLAAYVQVTSPIRRYADLMAHWQLKVRWTGLGVQAYPKPYNLSPKSRVHNPAHSNAAFRGRQCSREAAE